MASETENLKDNVGSFYFHVRSTRDGVSPSDGWLVGTVEAGTASVGMKVSVKNVDFRLTQPLSINTIDDAYEVRAAARARTPYLWARIFVAGLVGHVVPVGTVLRSDSQE